LKKYRERETIFKIFPSHGLDLFAGSQTVLEEWCLAWDRLRRWIHHRDTTKTPLKERRISQKSGGKITEL